MITAIINAYYGEDYVQEAVLSIADQVDHTIFLWADAPWGGITQGALPIVGDDKYGGRKVVRVDHRWCGRQFLHAHRLEFTHPVSLERMAFKSQLPEDLSRALSNLNGTHQ